MFEHDRPLRRHHDLPRLYFAGNPVDADNFRSRVWPRIFAKAELRQVRIHDLRHTFASLLIAQGESLAYVRDQLGHASEVRS
jgi:integrase